MGGGVGGGVHGNTKKSEHLFRLLACSRLHGGEQRLYSHSLFDTGIANDAPGG